MKIKLLQSVIIQLICISILTLLTNYSLYSQKLNNASDFGSNVSVSYDECRAEATVTFIWKEDNGGINACRNANTLRWLDIRLKDENNLPITLRPGVDRLMSIRKRKKANEYFFPILPNKVYFTYDCNHMDHYYLQPDDLFDSNVGGTGNTRKITVTFKNLPNSIFDKELKFHLRGWVDYNGTSGDNDDWNNYYPSGRGFWVDVNKSVSPNPEGIAKPNFNLTQGPCSNAELSWTPVIPPGGTSCGQVSYDIYRDGILAGTANNAQAMNNTITWLDPYVLESGESVQYYMKSKWIPLNSSNVDYSLPSTTKTFNNAPYNGKITATVKTPAGIPLPGVLVVVFDDAANSDNTPFCMNPSTDYAKNGETDSNGQIVFDNIWYGHPDDTSTAYNVNGYRGGSVLFDSESVSLDDQSNNITVDLVDAEAYVIQGKVKTAMTCGLDSAVISAVLISNPTIPIDTVQTDETGDYAIVIPGPGMYKAYSQLSDCTRCQ